MITISIPTGIAAWIVLAWLAVQVMRLRARRKIEHDRASVDRIRARGARWALRDADALDQLANPHERRDRDSHPGGVL